MPGQVTTYPGLRVVDVDMDLLCQADKPGKGIVAL